MGRAVWLSYSCPDRDCRLWNQLVLAGGHRSHTCTACSRQAGMDVMQDLASGESIDQCVMCGGREFFIRKDFPQKLGLGLVILFALTASVFYYFENVPATFATLAALVVVDAVIYLFVGRVTVCYRCRAEYRGLAYNPSHRGFDLATSEKYER
jgi:hypothetical protein